MNADTPLAEVALHLPKDAATLLLTQDELVQTCVLIHVRAAVVFWEQEGHVFDPVQYEGVLNGLVPALTSLSNEMLRIQGENEALGLMLARVTLDNLLGRGSK